MCAHAQHTHTHTITFLEKYLLHSGVLALQSLCSFMNIRLAKRGPVTWVAASVGTGGLDVVLLEPASESRI